MFYKTLFFCLLIFPTGYNGVGQERSEFDSLTAIYRASEERNNLELLKNIIYSTKQPDSMIKYSNLLIKRAEPIENKEKLQFAYFHKGIAGRYKGDYRYSFDNLYKSAKLAEELRDQNKLGKSYVEIANAYAESGDLNLSSIYFERGIDLFEAEEDTSSVGVTYYNMGDTFFDKGELDSSLVYTSRSRDIFQEMGNKYYEAYSLGNLGRIYAARGEYDQAELHLNNAIGVLSKIPDHNALTDFYSTMSEIQRDKGNMNAAINYADQSLKAAQANGLKEDLQTAHQKLALLHETAGNTRESYEHYKRYIVYKDSIEDIASVKEVANLRSNYEIARKQTEVDLLNEQKANQRNIAIATGVALFLIMLLALGLYRRNKYIGRTKKLIEKEKNRSENLLLNILPQETAMELKEKGRVEAKRFDAVSILFTDFQNFTHFAENLPPEELVKSVDYYFSKFDEIVEQHGLEKIKTVGDAYMCAAGVPFPVEDHAERILSAACDMISFVKEARKLDVKEETRFDIRIGVNSGPVVAGVVGSKKWAYDIWGDAVNIAARMETCSQPGRVNISENTYELIKDKFDCTYRGEIMVKNKGMMKMYFVKGIKDIAQTNVA